MTSLFRRPEIMSAVHLHAPLALPGGKTPLHIVARGKGWLRISSGSSGSRSSFKLFCDDGFDAVVCVDVAPSLRVEFRSLVGRAVVVVTIPHILDRGPEPSPQAAIDMQRVSAAPLLTVPDLRPPAVKPLVPAPPKD